MIQPLATYRTPVLSLPTRMHCHYCSATDLLSIRSPSWRAMYVCVCIVCMCIYVTNPWWTTVETLPLWLMWSSCTQHDYSIRKCLLLEQLASLARILIMSSSLPGLAVLWYDQASGARLSTHRTFASPCYQQQIYSRTALLVVMNPPPCPSTNRGDPVPHPH